MSKKGVAKQVLFTMVDATDFATRESALVASDFGAIFWGATNDASTATASAAVSKAISVCNSGVYKAILKTSENNYDNMLLVIKGTGSADQVLVWENVANTAADLSDTLSGMSDILSDVLVLVTSGATAAGVAAAQSDINSVIKAAQSDINSHVSGMAATTADAVWDEVHSDHVGASSFGSAVQLTLAGSGNGVYVSLISAPAYNKIASAVWTADPSAFSAANTIGSLVTHELDGLSALGAGNSDILSDVKVLAEGISNIQSGMSDALSDVLVLVTSGATAAGLVSATSDINSHVSGITATLADSDFVEMASKVWAADPSAISAANTIGSLLTHELDGASKAISDMHSDMKSNISAATSDINSHVSGITASIDYSDLEAIADEVWSDFESKVGTTVSDFYSQLLGVTATLADSDFAEIQSRVWSADPSAISAANTIGSLVAHELDGLSALGAGISNIQSGMSDTLSDTYAMLSDLNSNFQSRVPKAVATQSLLSDVQSNILSSVGATGVTVSASGLSAVRAEMFDLIQSATLDETGVGAPAATPTVEEALMLPYMAMRNKTTQTASRVNLFNNAGTEITSAVVSDDATTFTRDEFGAP